ncbi:hypothetical protein JST56_00610 [Candidatus Dependentiae bacterium]|nr:hypothetical protein [Candidatus Dependentiae bacterium]
MKTAQSTFKFICFLSLALMYLCLSFWSAKTFSFEDLFQGVDFEQLAKDIEKAVEEAEAKGELPARPMPGAAISQPTFPLTAPVTEPFIEPEKKAAADKQDLGKDLKNLFLEPIVITQEKGKQAPIKVSDQKQKAYDYYMDQLVELLASVEQIVETSPKISDQFKQFFTHYQDALDEITVQKDIFASKKLYLAVLYADNPATNELRKKIVSTVDELSKLHKQIQVTEAQEIKSAEREQAELLKRAQEKLDLPEPRKIIQRKKRGRRGAPEQKALPPKKINLDDDEEES